MPRPAEARAWWADVEDVRARIEHRRARERQARRMSGTGGAATARGSAAGAAVRAPATQRGVREVRPGRHLMVVRSGADRPAVGSVSSLTRRRARPAMIRRVGPRPDRVAAWAVVLGFALVLAAILSAHG